MSEKQAWKVGTSYLIRLVTHYWTGRLIYVDEHELVIEDAAWIPDTGRWYKATTAEQLSEIDPREGPVILGRGAVVDAVEWTSDLPRQPK